MCRLIRLAKLTRVLVIGGILGWDLDLADVPPTCQSESADALKILLSFCLLE